MLDFYYFESRKDLCVSVRPTVTLYIWQNT